MFVSGCTLLRQRNRTQLQGTKKNVQLGLTVDSKIKNTRKQNKTKQPTATSEEPGAKAGVGRESRVLCLHPALSTTYGVGGSSRLPLAQALGTVLAPHKDQLAPTVGSEQVRGPVVCSWFSLCSRGPDKDLPEFLVWPFINFY